jgi:hypothetical protein
MNPKQYRTTDLALQWFALIFGCLTVQTAAAQFDSEMPPHHIEISISQERDGKTFRFDTIIPIESLELSRILEQLPIEDFDLEIVNTPAPPPAPAIEPQYPARPIPPHTNDLLVLNRGRLGVYAKRIDDSLGVRITGVMPQSAAYQAGLQANDRIYALNGIRTDNFQMLQYLIDGMRGGDTVTIDYMRHHEARIAQAVLQTAPAPRTPNDMEMFLPMPPQRCQDKNWQRSVRGIARPDCVPTKNYCGNATRYAAIDDIDTDDKKYLAATGTDYKRRAKNLDLPESQIYFDPDTRYLLLNAEIPHAPQTKIWLLGTRGNTVFTEVLPQFGGNYRRGTYLPCNGNAAEIYYLLVQQGKMQYAKRVILP